MQVDTKRFFNFNTDLEEMVIVLKAESQGLAKKLAAQVVNMAASGMSEETITATITKDILGGQFFGGMRNSFNGVVGSFLDDISQGAIFDSFEEEQQWKWLTTSNDPCEDCYPRHGEVHTYEEWRELGLPRSGFSRCKYNCLCVLVPESSVPSGFGGPVTVKRTAEYRNEFLDKYQTDEKLREKVNRARIRFRFREDADGLKRYENDKSFKAKIDEELGDTVSFLQGKNQVKTSRPVSDEPEYFKKVFVAKNEKKVWLSNVHGSNETDENVSIAKVIAEQEKVDVRLLPLDRAEGVKSVDAEVAGELWEFKRPKEAGKNNIDRSIRAAGHQGAEVAVVDLRGYNIDDSIVSDTVTNRLKRKDNKIKRVLIIKSDTEILPFYVNAPK
jgi:hypothetical protein